MSVSEGSSRAGGQAVARWLFAMAAASVAFGIGLWSRQRHVLDDAYITYRYSRNLVDGLGPVYNAMERVEGYTNFLWMLLNAGALRLGLDPLSVSRGVGLACFASTAFVMARILAPLVERPRDLLACTPVLSLGVTAQHVDFAASGLEPGLWGLCVLTLGQQLLVPTSVRRDALISLSCLALLLTRLDGAPFVVAHGLISARQALAAGRGTAAALRSLTRRYGPFALAFAAYLTAKHAYYGHVLPNTFQAKSAGPAALGSGLSYLAHFVWSYPSVGLALPLAAYAALRPPRPEYAIFTRWALFSLLLYYAYLAAVGGDFMMYRLALQPHATLLTACAFGLFALLALRPAPALALSLVILALSPGWPRVDRSYYMQTMPEMTRYSTFGREVGVTLERVLPPNTVIATTLAGTLPYFSRLTTIDQLGLNDRWIARHGLHFPRSRGHTRRAPRAYLARRGVHLVFEHPAAHPCARLEASGGPRVFVRMGAGRCVGADYLVHSSRLTVHLCEHPAWFVLDGVRCPDTTPLRGLQLVGSQLQRHVPAPIRRQGEAPPETTRAESPSELRRGRPSGAVGASSLR